MALVANSGPIQYLSTGCARVASATADAKPHIKVRRQERPKKKANDSGSDCNLLKAGRIACPKANGIGTINAAIIVATE